MAREYLFNEDVTDDPACLASSRVFELTGVYPQAINHLRKEGLLHPEKSGEGRRAAWLYRDSDVHNINLAKRMGEDLPLTESLKAIRDRELLIGQSRRFLRPFVENLKGDELVESVVEAVNEMGLLTEEEKKICVATVKGEFPITDERAVNARNRDILNRARGQIAKTLFLAARVEAVLLTGD